MVVGIQYKAYKFMNLISGSGVPISKEIILGISYIDLGLTNRYKENTIKDMIIVKIVFCYKRIIASLQEPYQTYIEDGCTSANCFHGLYADVFHSLKDILNFTSTIQKINLTLTSMEMIGNV